MFLQLSQLPPLSTGPNSFQHHFSSLREHTERLPFKVPNLQDIFPALPRYPFDHSWVGMLCGRETNFSWTPQARFEPMSLGLDSGSADHSDHCATSPWIHQGSLCITNHRAHSDVCSLLFNISCKLFKFSTFICQVDSIKNNLKLSTRLIWPNIV